MPRRRTKRRLRKRQTGMIVNSTNWDGSRVGQFTPPNNKRVASKLNQIHGVVKKVKSVLDMASGQSNTTTKTKNKKQEWQVSDQDGIKYHVARTTYKAQKRQRLTTNLSQVGTVYTFGNGGLTSTIGVQNAGSIAGINGTALQTLHTALNDAVPVSINRASEKFSFIGSTDEIEFMNCAPTSCEFDIYVLIDKTTDQVSSDPGTIWQAGISQEQNNADLPLESFNSPWQRPTDVKAFRIAYWSKRYPCVLSPGQKCKFTYIFKRNRLLDTSYMFNYEQIRGITHKIYVVARGTIVDSTNDKAVSFNGQSLSEVKLVFIRKISMNGSILSTLPRVNKQIILTGGTATGVLPTALAGQWHIDEDTGEPENAAVVGEFA